MMHTLEKNFDIARIVIILKLQREESNVFKKKILYNLSNK